VSALPVPSESDGLAAALFASEVLVQASPIDADDEALLPAERELVARAIPKRRREFATGRRCARALLVRLGHPGAALLRHPDRTPDWPAGVVGSISHCDDRCVVALARRGAIAGLGVDVEPDLPLERALWRRICTPHEIRTIVASRATAAEQGRAARLVFAAKEAFYKSVSARVGRVLGFQEVEIQVDWSSNRFQSRLEGTPTGQLGGTRFEGRFVRCDGLVVTGATLWAARDAGGEAG
jgi:4'-phosphopantetheinyl transferase EntD